MLFSKFPSLSFTVSHMMIYDNKSKTLGACADQMRHFMRILTKQKFFRQTRSIAYVKLFLFIHILKMSKICGLVPVLTSKLCVSVQTKENILGIFYTEQKLFRIKFFTFIPILKMSKILSFVFYSDKDFQCLCRLNDTF